MKNQIPLPQDIRLYEVSGSSILEPRLSILELDGTCVAAQYGSFKSHKYLFQSYSQNFDSLTLLFDDKNVSALRNGPYFSLNGFDYGFVLKFLNLSSPTISFLPLISGIDTGVNVTLNLSGGVGTINPYSTYLTLPDSGPKINDYILLTNQTDTTENVIYRITDISGSQLTVYNDSAINTALTQNQNYIFLRTRVEDSLGTSYYGLYYDGGYHWISQTKGIKLTNANYGIYVASDLTDFYLSVSIFTAVGVAVQVNETIAINILGGGRTSGIYTITKISNNNVYFEPVYPAYVFVHQFVKVTLDFSTLSNSIWYVNPVSLGYTNHLYGTVAFSFLTMTPTNISSDPSLWASQIGGEDDVTIGFTLFNNITNNPHIHNSDIFYFTVLTPTWVDNNSVVEGLSICINYTTDPLQVLEGIS